MRQVIATDKAPAAVGPYSQAVRAKDLVFASGQIALDPATGELVGSTAAEQTRQVMANLEAVLTAAGTSWSHVVKTTIYLVDMAEYPKVNEAYAAFFTGDPPARATVAVAALPKGALVEIDAIATVG